MMLYEGQALITVTDEEIEVQYGELAAQAQVH